MKAIDSVIEGDVVRIPRKAFVWLPRINAPSSFQQSGISKHDLYTALRLPLADQWMRPKRNHAAYKFDLNVHVSGVIEAPDIFYQTIA